MQAPVRAAEYLRTSTLEQPYSMEMQKHSIREYALAHGYEIVRTYADHGRSGLTVSKRPGFLAVLQDIASGAAEYAAVLVFDVTRWGRFQDGDESAHYEFVCKALGVPVHYCSESFNNDQELPTFILKSLKRAIAAEYSRELSVKCFLGQRRLAEKGFRVGAQSGYGVRRMAISADKLRTQLLADGERKSISSDRIVLVPGPPEEVSAVRTIFGLAACNHGGYQSIADELNHRHIPYIEGRPWKSYAIEHILKNRKYCGYNLWNRTSQKLGTARRRNLPAEWVVVPGAFPALIDNATFERAQLNLPHQKKKWEEQELLSWVNELSQNPGTTVPGCPSFKTLRRRLTGVSCLRPHRGTHRAALENGAPQRRQRIDVVRNYVFDALWKLFPDKLVELHLPGKSRRLLKLLSGTLISILVCDREPRITGIMRWRLRPVEAEANLVTLICLMQSDCIEYYLTPNMEIRGDCCISKNDRLFQSAMRLKDLGEFFETALRMSSASV
jgi:DNA invertase Pin-like site-specific DNA recombinase